MFWFITVSSFSIIYIIFICVMHIDFCSFGYTRGSQAALNVVIFIFIYLLSSL